MNRFAPILACLAALLTVAAPLAVARAQQIKPAVVVSLASIDEVFNDTDYLGAAAGTPEFADMLKGAGLIYASGLDKTRPSGAYVTFDGLDVVPIAFVPVSNLGTFLDIHKRLLKPEELDGGIIRLGTDEPLFIKEQKGWAFVARDAGQLENLPADPVKLLGGLEKEYTVAARVNVRNIPATYREMAATELEARMKESLNSVPENDREFMEAMINQSVEQYVSLIQESDQITIGWAVDSMAKSNCLDFTFTAVAGTTLAKRMALVKDTKSDFAGFLLPDAAVNFNMSSSLLKQDVEQYAKMLTGGRAKLLADIENNGQIPSDALRKAAKDIVGTLMDVAKSTIEKGKIDGGGALLLGDKSITFAGGFAVADGAEVDRVFRKAMEIAQREADEFPPVKLNSGKHKDVTFHTITIPIPEDEEEARKILGAELDVIVGIGDNAAYLAVGEGGLETLKSAIDKSAASASKTVPASQVNVALTPILKFAASIDQGAVGATLGPVIEALGDVKGQDRITMTSKSIPNGARSRLSVDEGVLKAIGAGVKGLTDQFGAGGLPGDL